MEQHFKNLAKYSFLRPGDELYSDGPIVIRKCNDGDIYVTAAKPCVVKGIKKKYPEYDEYEETLPVLSGEWFIPSSDEIKTIFNSSRVTRELIESNYNLPHKYMLSDPLFKECQFKKRNFWALAEPQSVDVDTNIDYDHNYVTNVRCKLYYDQPVTIESYFFCSEHYILPFQKIKFTDLHFYL